MGVIAKSEQWRGGEQKKWKKWNLTCLVVMFLPRIVVVVVARTVVVAKHWVAKEKKQVDRHC